MSVPLKHLLASEPSGFLAMELALWSSECHNDHNDQMSNFEKELVGELFRMYTLEKSRTIHYDPQGNDQMREIQPCPS